MSASELHHVEAVLEGLLPDPAGFAERVFQQLVDRLTSDVPGTQPAGIAAPGETGSAADRNAVLAAAVGACDCWGERADCPVCGGEGSAGWVQPDSGLYAAYVEPAVTRSAEDAGPGDGTADEPAIEGEPA